MKNFYKNIVLIAVLIFISGCATQSTKLFAVSEHKSWKLGEGPLVTELVKLPQDNIKNVALKSFPVAINRGKFESDDEFKTRVLQIPNPIFIAAPIVTSKENNCETIFDHEKAVYVVKNCLPVSSSKELLFEIADGEAFALANMFDSRSIRRKLINRYFLLTTVDWNAELIIPREIAKELDKDLMFGIVISRPVTSKNCSLCENRDLQDTLAELSALSRKKTSKSSSWRDDAFREGELLENWNYRVQVESFSEIVIFRKSDQKILDYRKFTAATQN